MGFKYGFYKSVRESCLVTAYKNIKASSLIRQLLLVKDLPETDDTVRCVLL